jgi:hypothetical protein
VKGPAGFPEQQHLWPSADDPEVSDIAEMQARRRVAFQHVMNSAHPSPDQVRLAFNGRFPEQFRSRCIFDPAEMIGYVRVEPHTPWPEPPAPRSDFTTPCGVEAKLGEDDAGRANLTVTDACGIRGLALSSVGFTRGIIDGGHLPGVVEGQILPALALGKAVLVTYNDADSGARPEVTPERATEIAESLRQVASNALLSPVGVKYEARAHYEPHCPNSLYRFYLFPVRAEQVTKGPETGVMAPSQHRITQSAQFVGLAWSGSND